VVLDLVLVAGEVEKFQQVVVVKEDLGQTADKVLLTSETCNESHTRRCTSNRITSPLSRTNICGIINETTTRRQNADSSS